MKREVPLRIVVEGPLAGVAYRLQKGKTPVCELVDPVRSSAAKLEFELSVLAGERDTNTAPRLTGPYAQGPADARFVYVNSGTLAGQHDSGWTRRAKVTLAGITWEMVEAVAGDGGRVLEARMPGVGRDGGPTCASFRLLGDGWVVR